MLNYVDRMVLAAVVGPIKKTFFGEGGIGNTGDALASLVNWFQHRLGFRLEDALIGVLGTAFMLTYMIGAPVFGRLAERRSRWVLIAVGVGLWSLASGASGLAATFLICS